MSIELEISPVVIELEITEEVIELEINPVGIQGPVGPQGPAGSGDLFANITVSQSIEAVDTNTVYTNFGATSLVAVSLPAGAQGLKFTFLIVDADGFSLIADGSDAINIGNSGAGTMTNTKVGGSVVLYGYSGGWIAAASQGVWIDS